MQGLANSNPNQTQNPRTSTIDVPVRILVPSESVGAIIGKGGQTIRQLTQQTRAKVDVYRGDPMAPATALQEKVITIRGQPENCINACREILKVMKADAESKNKPSDTPLKVLAHNDYIGRIIGKQGNIINTIKKETETSVTVSSINDMSMNVERVITVKGELENMIKALEIIHSKVKSAFENDTKTYGAQAIMMGGLPPIPLAPSAAYAPTAAAAAVAAAAAAAAAFNAPPNSAARFAAAAAAAAAQHAQHPSAQSNAHPASLGGAGGAGSGVGGHNPHHPGSAPTSNNPQSNNQTSGSSNATGGNQSGGQNNYQNYYPPLYHPAHAAAAAPPPPPHHPHAGAHAHPGQTPAANLYANPASGLLPPQSVVGPHATAYGGAHTGHGGVHGAHNDLLGTGGPEPETVYLYIPNVAVGAIIGTKGSYIKNIIKLSGASVKITPLTPEESKTVLERQVVIVGTPESQWKAQYYIYEKIRQERFTSDENVKLRAELQVPSHIVGRIIGKSGKNVRDLQKQTGATIKLPEDANLNQQQQQQQSSSQQQQNDQSSTNSNGNVNSSTSNNDQTANTNDTSSSATTTTTTTTTASVTGSDDKQTDTASSPNPQQSSSANASQQATTATSSSSSTSNTNSNNQSFVIVRIYGTFNASQCAQRRIQSLVSHSLRGTIDNNNSSLVTSSRMPLNPIMNHNHQSIPNHYHQRNDYQHHSRTNGAGSGYNRKNNRHHQQQGSSNNNNNNSQNKDQHHQKDQSNSSLSNSQQQNGSNGASSSSSTSIDQQQQQSSSNNNTQPQTPTQTTVSS